MADSKVQFIPINSITLLDELQLRVDKLNEEVVEEYREAIEQKKVFPPVTIIDDGVNKFLVDGFHRLAANGAAGKTAIEAEIIPGTKLVAFTKALNANSTNGLTRTNADKRNVVMKALGWPEFQNMKSRDLGNLCGVSHTLVNNIRAEINEKQVADDPVGKISSKAMPFDPVTKLATIAMFFLKLKADNAYLKNPEAVEVLKELAAMIEDLLQGTKQRKKNADELDGDEAEDHEDDDSEDDKEEGYDNGSEELGEDQMDME